MVGTKKMSNDGLAEWYRVMDVDRAARAIDDQADMIFAEHGRLLERAKLFRRLMDDRCREARRAARGASGHAE